MLWITVLIVFCEFVNHECRKQNTKVLKIGFYDVVKSPAFVDKTLLLKEFLNYGNTSILITAPHGFGKTTNLDMIRRFCGLQVSSDGSVVPIERTENYKVFTAKYMKGETEERLDVFKDRQFFDNHFGKYPVIYLDFKSLKGSSYDHFLRSFRRVVATEFRRHKYLLTSKKLNDGDRSSLNDYFEKIVKGQATKDDILKGVKFLTEVLCNIFGSKVIVLVDEYDAAVQDALFRSAIDLEKIIDVYHDLIFYLFKFNYYVERALVNGCLRQSGADLIGENDFEFLFFTRKHNFKSFYGFTKDEVLGLATKFKISNEIKNIESWYGGYNESISKLDMFHVDSVVKYLKCKVFRSYWPKLKTMERFRKLFSDIDFRSEVFGIVENGTYIMEEDVADRIKIMDLHKTLSGFLLHGKDLSKISLHKEFLLFQFMLDLGYYKSKPYKRIVNGRNAVTLQVPNKQMEREIQVLAQKYLKENI